jgi:hypothetical protein
LQREALAGGVGKVLVVSGLAEAQVTLGRGVESDGFDDGGREPGGEAIGTDVFVAGVDTVASDYRGSALIERRIDPNDTRLPDYATNAGAPSLDQFYSFRVLERKRFTP